MDGIRRGFGGSIVADGRFVFDPAALDGLQALVHLVAQFQATAASLPPSASDVPGLPAGFAPDLPVWQPPGAPPSWARSQRNWTSRNWTRGGHGRGCPFFYQAAPTGMTWLVGTEAQPLLAAAGNAPVLAEARVQQAFWQAQPADDQAVGDWANLAPLDTAWPATPAATFSATGSALSAAVVDPSQLGRLVAQAAAQLDAELARPAVGESGAFGRRRVRSRAGHRAAGERAEGWRGIPKAGRPGGRALRRPSIWRAVASRAPS